MLIDSNILIYALNTASPKHHQAQAFLQSQSSGTFFIAQQNIFECLRILTHSQLPSPFSPLQALQAVEPIIQAAIIIHPTFETAAVALELMDKYQIKGSEVFDAYLVATLLCNEIQEIATDNVKHLGKYEEIDVINPFRV